MSPTTEAHLSIRTARVSCLILILACYILVDHEGVDSILIERALDLQSFVQEDHILQLTRYMRGSQGVNDNQFLPFQLIYL